MRGKGRGGGGPRFAGESVFEVHAGFGSRLHLQSSTYALSVADSWEGATSNLSHGFFEAVGTSKPCVLCMCRR